MRSPLLLAWLWGAVRQAGHWLLNMMGLVPDKEDTHQTGAPEFPVAVRTQLLVGETSYAIQDQPAYAAAFTRMEHMEEDACVQACPRLTHWCPAWPCCKT